MLRGSPTKRYLSDPSANGLWQSQACCEPATTHVDPELDEAWDRGSIPRVSIPDRHLPINRPSGGERRFSDESPQADFVSDPEWSGWCNYQHAETTELQVKDLPRSLNAGQGSGGSPVRLADNTLR